jgi:predicted nucleotidyltransferase component of viral defense system
VKVDVTFKEHILTPIDEKNIIKTYEEYVDFLSDPKVKVYSLEEVAIEKTCALFSSNRNEPRDLYDMYCLITEKSLDISLLESEIKQKMEFKGQPFEKRQGEFDKKEPRLKKTWETRLSKQMISLPEYDEVFREVKRAFRQAGLLA